MIVSMTGFAAVAAELPGLSLAVELRSVNHRYLDIALKLPDELRSLEPALRERLAAEVKRGKVECRVALNRVAASVAQVAIDQSRVRALAQAAAEIRQLVPAAAPLSAAEILRWPGVMIEPAVAPEALAAHRELTEEVTGAGLLAITSPDRLHRDWQAARTAGEVSVAERLLARLRPGAALVTVGDCHPAALSWLGAAAGNRIVPMGVDRFGQSGDIPDLYQAYHIDAEAILDGAARACLLALR